MTEKLTLKVIFLFRIEKQQDGRYRRNEKLKSDGDVVESGECETSCDASFQLSRFSASCFTDPLTVTLCAEHTDVCSRHFVMYL